MKTRMMCFAMVVFLLAFVHVPESQAQSWTNLSSGMNNHVRGLACDTNGNLYAGGAFTTAGGVAANRIAKWNGTTWTNLGSGINNYTVLGLACDTNGNLYAGGWFTNAGGVAAANIAKWNGTSWTNLGSGMGSYVEALAFDTNGNLYAGGDFTTAGGVAANYIAKWNGTTWTNLGSGINYYIMALAFDTNGNLYAGGYFTNAGGVAAANIAKWDGTSWTNLGSGLSGIYSTVNALAFDTNGNLYAGGPFTTAGGVAVNCCTKWNGTTWTNLGSGLDYFAYYFVFDAAGNLYAGGGQGYSAGENFYTAGGVTLNNIAKWGPRDALPPPEPVIGPMIKANGSTNDIIISHSDNLSITVQLNPGLYQEIEVDWWVVALAGSSWYYLNNAMVWTPFDSNLLNCHPVYQGPLFNLSEGEVLNMRIGSGSYTFWFAVDYPMDGNLTMDAILVDAANVTVQ